MMHQNYTAGGVQQLNCVCSSTITGRRMNIDRSHHHFSKVYHSKSVALLPLHMAVLMLLFPFFVLSNASSINVVRQLRFGSARVPETTVARAGQTLTLNCEANGSPAPEVSWMKNGIPVLEVTWMSFFLRRGIFVCERYRTPVIIIFFLFFMQK